MKKVTDIQIIDFLEGELRGHTQFSLYNFLMNMSRTKKMINQYRDLKRALLSLDTADEMIKNIDLNKLHNKIMLEIRMGESELGRLDKALCSSKANPIYKSKKGEVVKQAQK